jgi:hypothetical protein
MQNVATGTPARRPGRGGTAAIVAAGLLALISLGFLAGGGLLLWADSARDDQGFISTRTDRFSTDTTALATENLDLDLDLDGAESLVDEDFYGKVRINATSNDGKPLFVGIARTSDVTEYLRGSAHDLITDVDYSPFHVDYRTHAGSGTPEAPGKQRIWAASAQGAGAQALTWDVADGDWSVVVMNADGSAGVDADLSAGASLGFLDEAGKISLTTGFVLLILAGGLLYAGVRPGRSTPLGGTGQATVAAA